MKNEVNEVAEIHKGIRSEYWGMNSGEEPEPTRWSEITISRDIKKAMSLVQMYDENDYCEDTIYEECDHYHGSRFYYHPEPKSEEGKEDWLLWNQAWREVLFKRLIEMKMKNESLWNEIEDLRFQLSHRKEIENEID